MTGQSDILDASVSDEVRGALLALYATIDADGGDDPDEGEEFNRGYRTGLEMALVRLDEALNAGLPPDDAWIAEGLSRLRAALSPKQEGSAS